MQRKPGPSMAQAPTAVPGRSGQWKQPVLSAHQCFLAFGLKGMWCYQASKWYPLGPLVWKSRAHAV